MIDPTLPMNSENVARNLSFLDRHLAVWIFAAMALGVAIELFLLEDPESFYAPMSGGTNNLPVAMGLIFMMYPSLAKAEYSQPPKVRAQI